MTELLHYIVANIISDPDQIKITKEDTGDEIVLHLEIPEEDRGTIIGKNGVNIKAIRNIISIIARRENKKVYIKIQD